VGGIHPIQVALFLASLLASAYFSALEISLISANRLRLRQEGKDGSAGARLALELLRDRERVLATTLVGVNLSNLTAAAIATAMLQSALGSWDEWKVTVLTTGAVTLVILVAAEIVPKVYGKQAADRFLVASARPVVATEQLFLPVTAAVKAYLALLVRLLRRTPRRPVITREELKILVHEVKGETGHGRKERKMLGSILDFGETTAREVMVPMTDVVSVERQSSVDLVRALVKRHGYTRLPVYERRVDKVVGIVNVYDVLFDPDPAESIEPYIRAALLVPETKRIDRLMVELQRRRQTMAVTVSEFGSCVGVVTMEDIVEEIFGELAEEREVGVRKIRAIGERTFVVDALTDIDDLNEELSLDLPKGRYDTIGGLVLRRLGRIPREHEGFEIQGVRIEVIDAHPYGVRTVKLVLPERETGEADGA
jgi:CBS domain containing-hemolysin-like protein